MNVGVLGAIGAMLCWGFGDFFIQRTARKIGDLEALAWISILGAVVLVPFIFHELALLSAVQDVLLLLLLAVVTFVAAIFNFEALKEGKIAVIEMVVSLELPFTILLGVLFLHEWLTLWQLLLIIVLMIGSSMISVSQGKLHFHLERGVWFALAAAVLLALTNFLTARCSVQISPLMAVWFPFLAVALLCLFFIWRRKNGMGHFFGHVKNFPLLILSMSVFDTAAWLFYAYALRVADLGITTAITQGYPVVALLLGVTINRERITAWQYGGAAIVIATTLTLALLSP
jgi:drug/metabolite transporter (DMT)-like permease